MKLPILLLAAALAGSLALQADEANTLTDAEKAEGWKLLFDGKDLSHCRNFK